MDESVQAGAVEAEDEIALPELAHHLGADQPGACGRLPKPLPQIRFDHLRRRSSWM